MTKTTITVEEDFPFQRICSVPLPGEAAVDENLLSSTTAELNRIYISKGMETAQAIGNYVLKAFFNGSLDSFYQNNRNHISFRELANREDLAMAYSTIWYSVAVLGQLRYLPEDIANSLTLSHHKLLLPIKDAESKIQLAEKAVNEGMSVRQLKDYIKEVRYKENGERRKGKPRVPDFVKELRRLRKSVESSDLGDVINRIHQEFGHRGSAELEEELGSMIGILEELKKNIKGKLMTKENTLFSCVQ